MDTKNLSNIVTSLQSVLNSVQANIFIADRDFNLVYMNPKARKTLSNIEYEVFEVFNIGVRDFIGESIHRFHRNPDHVERILRNPRALPHEALFIFGGIHLKTSINTIPGLENEITGYIVNWENISEKVKLLGGISGENVFDTDMEKLVEELKMIEENESNNH